MKFLLRAFPTVALANFAAAQFNYSFPDCTNGPLKSTVVCNTSKDPATRARALIQMFTDEELTQNTDNVSPGVARLGVPPYQWWSEALVSVFLSSFVFNHSRNSAWSGWESWGHIRRFG
jgi:beta-D-xylosidase 4